MTLRKKHSYQTMERETNKNNVKGNRQTEYQIMRERKKMREREKEITLIQVGN